LRGGLAEDKRFELKGGCKIDMLGGKRSEGLQGQEKYKNPWSKNHLHKKKVGYVRRREKERKEPKREGTKGERKGIAR